LALLENNFSQTIGQRRALRKNYEVQIFHDYVPACSA
jgi:hypothetical protein